MPVELIFINSSLPSAEYMNLVSIGAGNGLSTIRCQGITWTNAALFDT